MPSNPEEITGLGVAGSMLALQKEMTDARQRQERRLVCFMSLGNLCAARSCQRQAALELPFFFQERFRVPRHAEQGPFYVSNSLLNNSGVRLCALPAPSFRFRPQVCGRPV